MTDTHRQADIGSAMKALVMPLWVIAVALVVLAALSVRSYTEGDQAVAPVQPTVQIDLRGVETYLRDIAGSLDAICEEVTQNLIRCI